MKQITAEDVRLLQKETGETIMSKPTFDSEHYNEDLTPKKCYECGCTTFHKKVVDTLDGHVMAFNLSCTDCGILLQFWDTGTYNAEMAWLSNGSKEFGR